MSTLSCELYAKIFILNYKIDIIYLRELKEQWIAGLLSSWHDNMHLEIKNQMLATSELRFMHCIQNIHDSHALDIISQSS